jgi:hypothetical protein
VLVNASMTSAETATTRITAIVTFDDGWWSVTVPELPGVFTHTSEPARAEAAIREAMAFAGDLDPSAFDIELVVLDRSA